MVKRTRCGCGNWAGDDGLCYRCRCADGERKKLIEARSQIEAKAVTKKYQIHIKEITWAPVSQEQLKDFLEMVDPKGKWIKFQVSVME